MNYQIDDQVVHWSHGPGKIIGIDEKRLSGRTRLYYVVEAGRATIWVPVDEAGEKSLRLPSTLLEFKELLNLLTGPGEELPDHQFQRRSELSERMQKRSLNDICFVIRDLIFRSTSQKLNRNDVDVLKRAKEFLLSEWELSLGIPRARAQLELQSYLETI
jgi:RNA polymerase-interacting CarD/CdnL/TRCF family regulator